MTSWQSWLPRYPSLSKCLKMRGQGKPTRLYLCLLSVCKMYVQFEMPEQRERRRPFKGQLLNNIHVMYSFITKNLIKCLERKETEEHFHFRSLSRCRRLYGQDCRIWQKIPMFVAFLASCHVELTLSFN